MTEFQRGLYRHYVRSGRRFAEKQGLVGTVTTIAIDTDSQAKGTGRVAVLDRTLPADMRGIVRILRVDDIRNDGEGVTLQDRHYPERQILRVVAELDDRGEKGVMCVTLDRLYGTVEWRFAYKSWGGTQVGGGSDPISRMIRPDMQPRLLALYRLCELLDADDERGGYGLYRETLAGALARPEGFGFPRFARHEGVRLIECHRASAKSAKNGPPEAVQREAWYARGWRDRNNPFDETLYFWVGRAETSPMDGQPFWLDHAVKIACENDGFGRVVPSYEYYIGGIWLGEGDSFFPLPTGLETEILEHVVRPLSDTSQVMTECLKAV